MMANKTLLAASFLAVVFLASTPATAQNPNWPNGPTEDPRDEVPSDPGYIHFDGEGHVTGGQWNLWGFTPELWADNPHFRQEEIAMGVGLHADEAWQVTTGSPEVVIAVLDSGALWHKTDLSNKYYLNRAELDSAEKRPKVPADFVGDPFDVNADGVFNVKDYIHFFPEELTRIDGAGNGNGIIDPEDLIFLFSDDVDDDGNGFVDDISGWDFFWNDNDAYDNPHYGHGNGEAHDSAAEGNNNDGGIGVCPSCSVLMCRVGDSFMADSNDFAEAVVFGVDSGVSIIQEALGSLNQSHHSLAAIDYAYDNNVVVIASAADELSFHHNMPGTANHTVMVHAIVQDTADREDATTFLNYNNCTNYGGQLLLSTPGSGCSSEATGKSSGHAGLIVSAALQTNLAPPLSAEEIRGLMVMSADDIDIPESLEEGPVGQPCTSVNAREVCGDDGLFRCFVTPARDTGECFNTKFPSVAGWDWHFGYGRNNARTSVDMVVSGAIPPEVDIAQPLWFETVDPITSPTVDLVGRIGSRVDGLPARYASYEYVVEYALGVDPKAGWTEVTSGSSPGIDGVLATLDLSTLPADFDPSNPPATPHEDALTLRVRVSVTDSPEVHNEFRKTIFIHHDETLFEGFPIYLGTSVESSPKMFDFDEDGKDELIVLSTDGVLHAYNEDASEVDGFPVNLGLRPGHDDALTNSHRGACGYRDDKTGCRAQHDTTLDVDVYQTSMSAPAIGDLEGDGHPEIVLTTYDGYVFAFHNDGAPVAGFPVRTDYALSADARDLDPAVGTQNRLDEGFMGAPTLYDLDGDGDLEIIAGAMDQNIYAWEHDGSTRSGFPVLCRDTFSGGQGARIVQTPAVGDLDNDGEVEIITGTNEVYDEVSVRAYIIHADGNDHEGGPFALEEGAATLYALIGEVLPVVGEGMVSNPVLADVDFDGQLEFAIEGIAGQPKMWKLDDGDLTEVSRVNNVDFGPGSNSQDSPAYPLINNGSFGKVDPSGDLAYVKGTAGWNFAMSFAEGGSTRAVFDHHISAWNTNPTKNPGNGSPYLEGFPQKVDDWQFFMNPILFDLDGDGLSEVLLGTGGYRVQAFNYKGEVPEGFPKFTGGWIVASPVVGDIDGDGKFDLATGTRNGWLYLWHTDASTTNRLDWQSFGHDAANTNNYATPLPRYGDARCGNGVKETGEDCDGTDLGGATCADLDDFSAGTLTCVECALDTTACTRGADDVGTDDAGVDAESDAGTSDEVGPSVPQVSGGSDDGCCAITPSRPTELPALPLVLLALGLALGVVRTRIRR